MLMSRDKLYIILLACCMSWQVQAQGVLECGEVIYERKINLHKNIKGMQEDPSDNPWTEMMLKNSPVYKIDYFTLRFENGHSEYWLSKEGDPNKRSMWGSDIAQRNTVYKNFDQQKQWSLKEVFESDFLIQDSVHKFKWKITNEFRNIAGYSCRRATTIIHDSLYVIAFYSEDLNSPSGPESFGNLPGMVLGLVIPRMNSTWMATEVKTSCTFEKPIAAPTKGKQTSFDDMYKLLDKRFDSKKKWFQKVLWNVLI